MEMLISDDRACLPFLDAVRAASRPAPACFGKLYGNSAIMQEVFAMIARVAPTSAAVLITGESGCGKELVARSLHERSPRSRSAFIAVNCGAIPPTLIEAELFGYEKGAFTGAIRQHQGCFERATGGTLFLDEITEMAPDMQVRLLRVLETGKFSRIGGAHELCADVRVVSATNREPYAAVRDNLLREDLMYRLAAFPLHLPPLRDREDDAGLLAEYFLRELNDASDTQKRFSRTALEAIREHAWPGNVRELRNAVQRAYIMSDDSVELALGRLACPDARGKKLEFSVGTPLANLERQAIFATLDFCRGNKRECAQLLGVSLKTLYNRLTAYHAFDVASAAS